MSCEQVNERMVDLLYGELAGEDRAAVEAHMAGCDRCRADVQGLRQARTAARAVLDEAPPSHVRARILDAAARAVAPAPRPAPAGSSRGFGEWIRSRWALPTLATVGAMAVFLLTSRLFLSPEKPAERGRDMLATEPAPTTASPGQSAESPVAAEEAQGYRANAEERAKAIRQSVRRLKDSAAERPRSKPARSLFKEKSFGGGQMEADKLAAAAPPKGEAAPAPPRDERREIGRAQKADQAASDDLREGTLSGLSKKREREDKAPEAAMEAEESEVSSSTARGAEAPASAAAPRALAKSGSVSARPAAPAAAPSAQSSSAGPTRETLLQRADRLFAERRWVEAAAAYRDLLKKFPQGQQAPLWRERLARSEAAAGSGGAAGLKR